MKKKVFKKFLFFVVAFACVVGFVSALNSTSVDAATLIWSDEFNGNSLDQSKWTYDWGTADWGWGNNEQQYYTTRTENVSVYDGALHIVARNEAYGGMNYTSGRIHSSGKFDFKYGTVEARVALPSSNGMWPALWMLGANHPQVGWPYCGEIDIIEAVNAENKVYGTNHWDSNGHASYGNSSGTFDITQYHTYKMVWDANYIRMYVDNNMYHEINIAGGTGGTEEFHKNFYFIINVAVGGQWPGYNIDAGAMPKTMLVDYLRVYQGTGSTSTNTGNSNNNTNTGNTNTNTGSGSNGNVILYKDANYGGGSSSLGLGTYTLSQLISKGFSNDALSSIKVPFGYKVTLYWDDNFGGSSKVITGDTGYVGGDWNDKMSSIKVEKGQYRIVSKYNGLALDIENAGGGYNVLQWGYNGGNWQKWQFTLQDDGSYVISSVHNGLVLDVTNWSTANGGNLQVWNNGNQANQRWFVTYTDAGYFFINKNSNKSIDIADWSTTMGTNIHQWDYFAQANQLWGIELVN